MKSGPIATCEKMSRRILSNYGRNKGQGKKEGGLRERPALVITPKEEDQSYCKEDLKAQAVVKIYKEKNDKKHKQKKIEKPARSLEIQRRGKALKRRESLPRTSREPRPI